MGVCKGGVGVRSWGKKRMEDDADAGETEILMMVSSCRSSNR